jgi:hypothetical protein
MQFSQGKDAILAWRKQNRIKLAPSFCHMSIIAVSMTQYTPVSIGHRWYIV